MTMKTADEVEWNARPKADVAADRICLKCRSTFWSKGFGERICSRCKGTAAWRLSVSSGTGAGRRRVGGGLS